MRQRERRLRRGALWEPRPPWDPLANLGRPADGLEWADVLARRALPEGTPFDIAGDDRLVRAFCARRRGLHQLAAVLPGDHSNTSTAALAVLAQRAMRGSLDDRQTAAMVSLALACERSLAVRGVDAVRASPVEPTDIVLGSVVDA